MKKLLFILSTLALVVMFTSANSNKNASMVGIAAGDFTIGNDEGVVSLKQLHGEFVLLTLWSSTDVDSRLENIKYNRYAAQSEKTVQLSVNFDRTKALFDELVKADSLDASSQYFCQIQDRSFFEERWGANKRYNTYLINPLGTIVAVNPSDDELSRIVK